MFLRVDVDEGGMDVENLSVPKRGAARLEQRGLHQHLGGCAIFVDEFQQIRGIGGIKRNESCAGLENAQHGGNRVYTPLAINADPRASSDAARTQSASNLP